MSICLKRALGCRQFLLVGARDLLRSKLYYRSSKRRKINYLGQNSTTFSAANMGDCKNVNDEKENKESAEEQVVTIENVVAKDNKGIDYDKLISKHS